jgi:hypothetical protein
MTKFLAYFTLGRLRERRHRVLRNRRSISELDPRSLSCSHSELMPRRLQQLGLDPAYVKSARTATNRNLERVCASCKAWRRCARDLANGDVQAGMRGYCLNAATIGWSLHHQRALRRAMARTQVLSSRGAV